MINLNSSHLDFHRHVRYFSKYVVENCKLAPFFFKYYSFTKIEQVIQAYDKGPALTLTFGHDRSLTVCFTKARAELNFFPSDHDQITIMNGT